MKQEDLEVALKLMVLVEDLAPNLPSEISDQILREEAEFSVSGLSTLEQAAALKQEISGLEEVLVVAQAQGRALPTTQKMIEILRQKQYQLSQQV